MDFIIGTLFLYSAYGFRRHYTHPAECSRERIKLMSLILMVGIGGYGLYRFYTGLGGAPLF